MVDVSVEPFEIEVRTRHSDHVRADVYLPDKGEKPSPVLLGASPYQKALRHLPSTPSVFPFIEYGPVQMYLDEGYAYVAMDACGTDTEIGEEMARRRRMERAGVWLTSTNTIVAELVQDWSSRRAECWPRQ